MLLSHKDNTAVNFLPAVCAYRYRQTVLSARHKLDQVIILCNAEAFIQHPASPAFWKRPCLSVHALHGLHGLPTPHKGKCLVKGTVVICSCYLCSAKICKVGLGDNPPCFALRYASHQYFLSSYHLYLHFFEVQHLALVLPLRAQFGPPHLQFLPACLVPRLVVLLVAGVAPVWTPGICSRRYEGDEPR